MKYDDNLYRADDRPDSSNGQDNRPDKRDLLRRRKIPAGKPSGKPGWSLGHRMAFLFLLILLGVFLWKQMNSPTSDYAKVSYSEFDNLLNTSKFSKVVISENTIRAELKNPQIMGRKANGRPSKGVETQIGTYDHAFVRELLSKGVEVSIEPERTWVSLLISTLPWIVLIGIWFILLRQMQGGPKGVFSFGKSKAKLMMEQGLKVTFADVAGVEEAKEELKEIIEFLKDPRKFQRLGGKIPKGALLVGPPGTGKTLLARAVAGEAGVPFFSMSGSDFVEMFVGVGASRVRDLFEQGKANAPCIIFIDEIDAVGRQRGAGIGGGHDEREQTLNQLLVEMDGFESNDGVILIAATNRPDVLDPALLRPGRFDRQIVVDWPDVKARGAILNVHAKKIQIDPRVDLDKIAKGTPGMTGADLANVVNEAALHAARINRKKVMMEDFEEAKDKVMMGAARKTLVITEEEKRLTAYHEAGHVLVSKFIPGADPVHKVSIVARGRSLGLTHFLPQDERHNWSFNFCMGKLTVLLGGRAAEMVKFTDVTNGASNDIERATNMARKMVCEWGMSKRLGPLTFGKKESEIFLGREIATHKDYSEQTAIAIDQEVRKYVEAAQQRAESIILEHMDKLEMLTAEILKKEVLAGDEIDAILKRDRHEHKGHGHGHGQGQRQPQSTPQPQAQIQPQSQPLDDLEAREKQPPREPGVPDQQPRDREERRRQRPPRQRRRRSERQAENVPVEQNEQESAHPAPLEPERPAEEPTPEPLVPAEVAADAGASGEAPVKTGSRRRRGSRSRNRKPSGQDHRGDSAPDISPVDNPSARSVPKEEKNDSHASDSQNSDETEKDSGGGKRKGSVFRERRARMVNLKTGGRRRFIKKAPAQKIREIN